MLREFLCSRRKLNKRLAPRGGRIQSDVRVWWGWKKEEGEVCLIFLILLSHLETCRRQTPILASQPVYSLIKPALSAPTHCQNMSRTDKLCYSGCLCTSTT